MHLDNLRYIVSHHTPDEACKLSCDSSLGDIRLLLVDELHPDILSSKSDGRLVGISDDFR